MLVGLERLEGTTGGMDGRLVFITGGPVVVTGGPVVVTGGPVVVTGGPVVVTGGPVVTFPSTTLIVFTNCNSKHII